MKLPFTTQEFLEVFREYNNAVFPLQILFVLLATFIILLVLSKRAGSPKPVLLIIAAFWFWMGIVYHIIFFSAINKAAFAFGAMFIAEGILLLVFSFTKPYFFAFSKDVYGTLSSLLLVYALFIYPLVGHLYGHDYPYAPTFGLPCPTTIFTFGIFILSKYRLPLFVIIIPVIWSVIGFTAAFALHMYEDTGLIIAGILFTIFNFTRQKKFIPANEKLIKLVTTTT